MTNANTVIADETFRVSQKLNKLTLAYYDKIGFNSTQRLLIGETQSKYKNLWKHDGPNVDKEFIVKNPYTDTSLNDAESEYLKQVLFIINQYRLRLSDDDVKGINPSNLSSVTKNDKLAEAISKGTYFDMPLVRREELSKYKNTFKTSSQKLSDRYQGIKDELKTTLDNRGLSEADLKAEEDSGLNEMYDNLNTQSASLKAARVDEFGIDFFEFNLDTIATRIVYSKIKKEVYDKALPVINSYVWWMKIMAGKSNSDLTKTLDYVANQIKLSAFGKNIIDDEFKDFMTVQSWSKKITTPLILGFRPAALAKELTIGSFKGIALAMGDLYDTQDFDIKSYGTALSKLMTIDKKFSNEFNLIDKLNATFRFANMDAGTYPQKIQTDRHGIMRGFSRYTYAANTIPDYYNRLVILIAKMVHDGSYEAYSDTDGELKYDPRKDKRFSYYLENRDKYKKDGKFSSAPNDSKFNEQRRKYLYLQGQLNQTQLLKDSPYTESDLVDKAYTEQEIESLKTLSNMAYGYYDKDHQQQWTNTWYGMTFAQMMQFWPGKMKQWFGKKVSASESAMGKVKQKTTKDSDGNEIPMWYETDENGIERETTTNTGDPVLTFEGTPFEGLAHSVLSVVKDCVKLDFKSAGNDKARLRRVAYALNDAFLMFVMFVIFTMIFKAFRESSGDSGLSSDLLKFGEAVSNKVANEQNLWDSTFGALDTDVMTLQWWNRTGNNMLGVVKGNKTILEAAGSSVGALEFLKDM